MQSSTPSLVGSITAVSGILDRPPSRTMTTEYDSIIPRRIRPSFASISPSQLREGAGKNRVRAAPAVSCAKRTKKTHTSIQVQRRHPAFPAQWLYGLLRVLPGERLFCHRRPLRSVLLEELDASTAASGPHDFAVRVTPHSSDMASASTASHRTFVTIASRPSLGETRGGIPVICPTG